IRNQGYAISDEEFEDGVFGFAVPIRDANSEVIAAFNLYGPKFRLEDSAWQRRIIEAMLAGATDLERKLN
ncbi:MAG: IclR family transcriptional regulator C-terminal domain-containing protein, partial [Anaerolineae bacterium]|nr:IclR family transcriptional regulator C-terminal domain-containing protein [Anaerolineae bacterium]